MNPSIMELIINPYFELNVTIVSKIHELDLEEVPVVKSKVIRVDLFVYVEPWQGWAAFKMSFR